MPHSSQEFEQEVQNNIQLLSQNQDLQNLSQQWSQDAIRSRYSYNFTWMGRPIIQFPQDMIVMQEIIWRVKPDLIIECGIAHGGSLIYYASLLELIGGNGLVLGIDIDIRPHNRIAIEDHPMSKRIKMIEGSSTDENLVKEIYTIASEKNCVLVSLDSNHTHEHVLRELELYSPLVTKNSYIVVFDTIIEDMPPNFYHDRDWDQGNNPKTAVYEFLRNNDRFQIDKDIQHKILITASPDGYLQCIK